MKRYNTESKAEKFIDAILEAHTKINYKNFNEKSIILLSQ